MTNSAPARDRADAAVPGFFLTVDGPGGVGKSTTVAALAALLAGLGHTVHATTEPSTSPLGTATRRLADTVRGRALACLVAADRHHHLDTEIRPHLAAGHTVVCDRYLPSSLVLQRLDGVPLDYIQALNTGIDPPDLAVILRAPADVIAARLDARGAHHRFEHDRATIGLELDLYQEAVAILGTLGIPVMVIDVDDFTPRGIAAQIVTRVPTGSTKVAATVPKAR